MFVYCTLIYFEVVFVVIFVMMICPSPEYLTLVCVNDIFYMKVKSKYSCIAFTVIIFCSQCDTHVKCGDCHFVMQDLNSGTCTRSKPGHSIGSSLTRVLALSQEQSSRNRVVPLNITYRGGGGGGGTFVFLVSCVLLCGVLCLL